MHWANVRYWIALTSFRLRIHKSGFAFHKPPCTTFIYVTKFFPFQKEHSCNHFLITEYLFKANYGGTRQKSSKSYINCCRCKPALNQMNPTITAYLICLRKFFNIIPSYIFPILSSLHIFLSNFFRSVRFLSLQLLLHSYAS